MAYNRNYFTGGQVTTPLIVEGAVTEAKIADNAVTSAKIKDETITGADIGAGQVQTADIADGAVTQAKLGPDVSVVPLADNSVTTPKIADNAVVAEKIANNAVVADKIAAGAVTSTKIPDGSITNAKLATNTITQGKIANNAIGTGEIQNGAVTAEKLAPGVGGGSRITFLPTRIQLTSLLVMGNQDWMPTAPNPAIPAEAVALILQVELINNLDGQTGFINCRIRQDATQQGALSLGVDSTYPGMITGAQAIVPVTAGSFQYAFTDMYGVVSVTFNPYIIGYVI
jgi:hypothetical protein